MWTVVYLAGDKEIAEEIKKFLQSEGFLVMLRATGAPQLSEEAVVEVLVPESEAEEAQEVLTTSSSWIAFRRSG